MVTNFSYKTDGSPIVSQVIPHEDVFEAMSFEVEAMLKRDTGSIPTIPKELSFSICHILTGEGSATSEIEFCVIWGKDQPCTFDFSDGSPVVSFHPEILEKYNN